MPANLTPEYMKAEERFKEAKSLDDKIEALEYMIAVLPKHKGTDKLFGDLKKRLSKLRAQETQKKGPAQKVSPYKIRRAGAGMAVLVGPPNSGKSSILAALTKAAVTVAPYPFTTRAPVPGMMAFENAQIQIVDTPAVTADFLDPDLPGLLRKADIVLLTLDGADPDILESFEMVRTALEQGKITLGRDKGPHPPPGDPATVKTFVIITKIDARGAADNIEVIRELLPDLKIIPISAETGEGLADFARQLFYGFNVVRVYTKAPGKQPDLSDPVYLKEGQTVLDFAKEIHKDFATNLKFARIWGEGKYDGQTVNREHVLSDGDILELHL